MFFSTVSHGKVAYCWKTTPRRASVPVTGTPSKATRPASGCRKPAARLSSVDLPQPLGPRTLTNSPERRRSRRRRRPRGGCCRDRSRRTSVGAGRRVAHRTTRSCQRTVAPSPAGRSGPSRAAESPISTMPARCRRTGRSSAPSAIIAPRPGRPRSARPPRRSPRRRRAPPGRPTKICGTVRGTHDPAEQLEPLAPEGASRTHVEVVDRRHALVDHDDGREERGVDEDREAGGLADAEVGDHQRDQRDRRQRAEAS